jgi:hypothetical protein
VITKTWALRFVIAVVWILLGGVLFVTSRGHTLLIDNRNGEGSPRANQAGQIAVRVDDKEPLKLFEGDRGRLTVTGSKHRIRVEFPGGKAPFEGAFTLPLYNDMYLLSVPRMVGGVEPFVEVFHTVYEPRNEEEAPEEELIPEP